MVLFGKAPNPTKWSISDHLSTISRDTKINIPQMQKVNSTVITINMEHKIKKIPVTLFALFVDVILRQDTGVNAQ